MVRYIIKNVVVKGNGLGKKELGFATAKVDFFSDTKIVEGCYSSKIAIDGELYLGITNISFNNYYISETHILNFNQDIYGKEIEITLLNCLRKPILAKTIKDSKYIIENDIKVFWVQRSCCNCKFFIAQDYGYSNYTVEGTNYDCLLEDFNGFRPKYGSENAAICPNFSKGEYWHIDVEGDEKRPSDEWIKAEYRNVVLEKLLK